MLSFYLIGLHNYCCPAYLTTRIFTHIPCIALIRAACPTHFNELYFIHRSRLDCVGYTQRTTFIRSDCTMRNYIRDQRAEFTWKKLLTRQYEEIESAQFCARFVICILRAWFTRIRACGVFPSIHIAIGLQDGEQTC
jgi:hypothetical protein